jgi:uncharacterized GH25 family protein
VRPAEPDLLRAEAVVFIGYGDSLPVDEFVHGKEIERYECQKPSGSTVRLKLEDHSLQANEVKLDEPGIYQFLAIRKPTFFSRIKGPDGKFSVQRVPKTDVKLTPGSTIEASGRSQVFLKAIATVGEVSGKAAARLGHALEIVPLTEVDQLRVGHPARFQVLHEGHPLPKVKVTLVSVVANLRGGAEKEVEADAEGIVELKLGEPGTWVLEVSHKAPASGDARESYDQEFYYASLAVGVKKD